MADTDRLDSHIDVCTERYGNLWGAISDIKGSLNTDRETLAQSNAAFHARLDLISQRYHNALFAVCVAAVGGLAGLVFYMLTHK